MAKDFLEELKDELNDMLLVEVQRLHDAVEKGERLPMIMTPAAVMRKVHQVAVNHQLTGDELMQILGSQELSGKEAALLAETAAVLDEE